MALKGIWVDKVNHVSTILAKDVNDIAHAVIELENNGGSSLPTENPVFDGVLTVDNIKIYRADDFEGRVIIERPMSEMGTPSSTVSFGYDQVFINESELYHKNNLKNLAAQNNILDEVEKNAFMNNTGLNTVLGDIETALDNIIAMQSELIGGDAE